MKVIVSFIGNLKVFQHGCRDAAAVIVVVTDYRGQHTSAGRLVRCLLSQADEEPCVKPRYRLAITRTDGQ